MKAPIFIVGEGRSGTTALRRNLAEHPNIWAVPKESYVFVKQWPQANPYYQSKNLNDLTVALAIGMNRVGQSLKKRGAAQYTKDVLAGGKLDENIAEFLSEFKNSEDFKGIQDANHLEVFDAICRFNIEKSGATRFVEKTPFHLFSLEDISARYPDAQVIGIYRDPRAVILSWMKRKNSSKSLLSAAFSWNRAARVMLAKQQDRNFKLLKYEDLISQPETTLRDLTDFLGEEFSPALLKEQKANSSFDEDRGKTGFKESSLDRWKTILSPMQIALIDSVCGKYYGELAIEPALNKASSFLGLYYIWELCKLNLLKVLKLLRRGN